MRAALAALVLLAVMPCASAQMDFANYETAFVHPIRVSADGSRLFVLNGPEARLEVYSLADPTAPLLLKQIQVGLEPTAVAVRTNDEAWVVSSLSDSVSVVSVREGRVMTTIPVQDEPYDVAFAGTPLRAFVSVGAKDEVRVFDVATKAQLAVIPIFGKDPRALAVGGSGTRVYVAAHRSGNKTTILPRMLAPAPPMPMNPMLPAAPQQSMIVAADDPQYMGMLDITLPDQDVFEIDAQTMTVTRAFSGAGTILFDLTVDAATGDLFVANTDARNLVRFEPAVRGHAIDSRITRITTGLSPSVTAHDLNAAVDYSVLPNAAAKAAALAEPTAVVCGGGIVYTAAQGSDRIGVVSPAGQVLARIGLGSTTTMNRRGPRGLALHPSAPVLYVFNRFANSVAVIDTLSRTLVRELGLVSDPTPMMMKMGRRFLYDAQLSGNGTMSCASCHVDGDTDDLAWDLGDPAGMMTPTPMQMPPFDAMLPAELHPMKGPFLTQTLRGLDQVGPFHWRGDRATLADFNMSFATLLGGTPLPPAELALFMAYLQGIRFHPNPEQTINRGFSPFPAGANALDGFNDFFNSQVLFNGTSPATCGDCHVAPIGMNGMIVAGAFIFETQPLRVAPVRTSYRRLGMALSGPSKSGFGIGHDGAFATVGEFLMQPEFMPWPMAMKDDLEAYMLSIDTGTAPVVGFTVDVNAASLAMPQTEMNVMTLMAQNVMGNCDVIAKGSMLGHERALLYDRTMDMFMADDPAWGPYSFVTLRQMALAGDATLTFMGVTMGTGMRQALDRDGDGMRDGVDGLETYGTPGTGSAGRLFFSGNREPRLGEAGFAFVVSKAPPASIGLIGVSGGPATWPMNGMTAYIDFTDPGYFQLFLSSDSDGLAAYAAPIANAPFLAGFGLYLQAAFADPAAPLGYVASNGLHLVIQP
jgi:DNA-binding beta-propeller fold protein YncE